MEQIQLTYIGQRLTTDNKLTPFYVDGTGKQWSFAKAILPVAIGQIIECTQTETGVRAPYKIVGTCQDPALVAQWSIESIRTRERKKELSDAKEKVSGDVRLLIDTIKANTHSSSDRRRLGIYILNKLMGA